MLVSLIRILREVWFVVGVLVQGNLRSWLQDPDGHDEFAVMYNGGGGKEKVAILYNTPHEPRPVTEREVSKFFLFLNVSVCIKLSSFILCSHSVGPRPM